LERSSMNSTARFKSITTVFSRPHKSQRRSDYFNCRNVYRNEIFEQLLAANRFYPIKRLQ
jgi:hypothetical protein